MGSIATTVTQCQLFLREPEIYPFTSYNFGLDVGFGRFGGFASRRDRWQDIGFSSC